MKATKNKAEPFETTITVIEPNWAKFKNSFGNICRHSKKITGDQPTMEVIETTDVKLFHSANSPTVTAFTVKITGKKPAFEGWKFLGSIIHDREDISEDILFSVKGESIPEHLRDRGCVCDHCNVNRYRKQTYVLENTLGNIIQVGSTCIQDFFGGRDISNVLSEFNTIEKIEKLDKYSDCTVDFGLLKPQYRIDIVRFVSLASAMIRQYGWTPKSREYEQTPTASLTWDYDYWYSIKPDDFGPGKRWEIVEVKPEDVELAKKAIAWARDIDPYANKEYLLNLKAICSGSKIRYKDSGFAASVINAYNNSIEQLQKTKINPSKHLGDIGDKITVNVTVNRISVSSVQWNYSYKSTFIYNFLDTNNNRLTWFASRKQDMAEGDNIIICGTVKKHDEFKGVKSTIITRCKITNANV